MIKNKILISELLLIISVILCSCGTTTNTTVVTEEIPTEEPVVITYEAMLYDNQGNNFLNFEGTDFDITPNKVKQYGWDSDGSWTYWYDTSSVVTVEIDGKFIQTCGSTVIFKDTRLDMMDIPNELNASGPANTDGYSVTEDGRAFETYTGLKNWWYDVKEEGQHGEKMVLIQSQDGYNIGAIIGKDVTWEVSESLPKTTKIMIDELPIYLHRCNFTIIDSEFLNVK